MKESRLKSLFVGSRGIVSKANNDIIKYFEDSLEFKKVEYATGEIVEGWKVPQEWKLVDAYICFDGEKISLKDDLLSVPFGTASWQFCGALNEAMSYINISNRPNERVYRTNYYTPYNKKICLSKSLIEKYQDCKEVKILVESVFCDGKLVIGEYHRKGKSDKTVLISTYCCHPSLGNDNFSGIIALEELAKIIANKDFEPYFSYRLAIFPETIGAICYIKSLRDRNLIDKIIHTLILTCLGGKSKNYSYKDSPYPNTYSKELKDILVRRVDKLKVREFTHDGSDERQFSSPGVRLSSSSLSRNRYYEYKEYHTSSDTYEFMNEESVYESIEYLKESILELDRKLRIPTSTNTCGEPSLSSKNISFHDGGSSVSSSGSFNNIKKDLFFQVYSLCNGELSTFEIVQKLSAIDGISTDDVEEVVEFLIENKFVEL